MIKTKDPAIKISITIKSSLREQIKSQKNKSKIVNSALELFLKKQQLMNQIEERRLEQMAQEWLQDIQKGDVIEFNPQGNHVNQDDLKKFLYTLAL